MLDMGFEPQLKRVIECSGLPKVGDRQTLMFSATFATNIQQIAKKYLRKDFAKVEVGRVGSSIGSISQTLVKIDAPGNKKMKLEILMKEVLKPGERTIVFVQKKHVATFVKKALVRGGDLSSVVRAEDIHGDRSQSQREAALAKFRAGEVDVLVATDVAARGLDVQDVVHVVQFDLPVSKEDFDSYVHRIGRTGRAGKLGRATAFYVAGHEPKVGNAALLPDLRCIFDENEQALPPWFAQEEGSGGATATSRSGAPKQAMSWKKNEKPSSGSGKQQAATGKNGERKNQDAVSSTVFAPPSRSSTKGKSKGEGKEKGAKNGKGKEDSTSAGPESAGKSTGGGKKSKGKVSKKNEPSSTNEGVGLGGTAANGKDNGGGKSERTKRSQHKGKGKGKW